MTGGERVFGVIPARGGSKGLPGKNVIPLGGLPLIAHTIQAATAAGCFTDVIVTTDDAEIAAAARAHGGEVPFTRPAHLATDTATTVDVVRHALAEREAALGLTFDTVVLLQPTTPLRAATDITGGLALFRTTGADAVVSYHAVESEHPYYMVILDDDSRTAPLMDVPNGVTRRQEFPAVYVRNGALYIVRRDVFVTHGSFYGDDTRAYIMPAARSVNIDSALDLALAEAIIARGEAG